MLLKIKLYLDLNRKHLPSFKIIYDQDGTLLSWKQKQNISMFFASTFLLLDGNYISACSIVFCNISVIYHKTLLMYLLKNLSHLPDDSSHFWARTQRYAKTLFNGGGVLPFDPPKTRHCSLLFLSVFLLLAQFFPIFAEVHFRCRVFQCNWLRYENSN